MSRPTLDDGGGELHSDSDAEQETNIDEDINDEEVESADNGMDQESLPVTLSSSPMNGTPRRFSAVHGEDSPRTRSPYAPDSPTPLEAPPVAGASVPPQPPPDYSATVRQRRGAKTKRKKPPSYNQLPPLKGVPPPEDFSYTRDDDAADAVNTSASSSSADEATTLLPFPPVISSERLTGEHLELQPVRGEGTADVPDDDEELEASPPPYDVAVARVVAGISQPLETSFGASVETRYINVPQEDESVVITDGRDEPPPHYRDIEPAVNPEQPPSTTTPSAVDVEANTDNAPPPPPEPEGNLLQRFLHHLNRVTALQGSTRAKVIITTVVLSCLLLFIILFPVQFSYVEYYQFALVRTKSTGRVATDRVYEHGCYVLGANKEFVYLNRSMTSVIFTKLTMFTRDNVDLSIDISMYYRLRFDDVAKLWKDYAGKHDSVIKAITQTTIQNSAPRVSQEEFMLRREYVATLLREALEEKFANWGIIISFVDYLNLHLPTRILDKKLKLLLLRIDIEKELAYQQQREIELGTEILTTPVIYMAKEAINNGTAKAKAIRTIATTEKSQLVDLAHSNAFSGMMNVLNVTQTEHALSFYYLATLNTIDHYGGTVEYSGNAIYVPN